MIKIKEVFARSKLVGGRSIEKPLNAFLTEFQANGYEIRRIIYCHSRDGGEIASAIIEYDDHKDAKLLSAQDEPENEDE